MPHLLNFNKLAIWRLVMYELENIKWQLNNVINELDDIAYWVNTEFKNIGAENCATCIWNVADQYRYVKSRLENIDTTRLADGYYNA